MTYDHEFKATQQSCTRGKQGLRIISLIHFNSSGTAGKAEISGSVPDQRLKVDTEFNLTRILVSTVLTVHSQFGFSGIDCSLPSALILPSSREADKGSQQAQGLQNKGLEVLYLQKSSRRFIIWFMACHAHSDGISGFKHSQHTDTMM